MFEPRQPPAACGRQASIVAWWPGVCLLANGVAGTSAVDRATRHALISDEPIWLDSSLDILEPTELERLAALGGEAALLVPMATAGRVVGLVELVSRNAGRHFHVGELAWLRTMANQAAATLENASLVRQLRDAAETDLLTGVYNHRHLQDRVRHETARAGRTGTPLSVLMIDLDDFKRINDEHGHQAGDRVLRAIAGALRSAVRSSDVVARYGGDEFVVLMPDTDGPEAALVAERARQAVVDVAHTMADGSVVHVACSAGLARHPQDGQTGRDLLRRADAAMYADKRARTEARVASGRPDDPPHALRPLHAVAIPPGDPGEASLPTRPDPRVPA
jgi:diguanylate cyclase (GGDEF)-like protein